MRNYTVNGTSPECRYYDWGQTAPREYGAFCVAQQQLRLLTKDICWDCEFYERQQNERQQNEHLIEYYKKMEEKKTKV